MNISCGLDELAFMASPQPQAYHVLELSQLTRRTVVVPSDFKRDALPQLDDLSIRFEQGFLDDTVFLSSDLFRELEDWLAQLVD